jgi:hypothetical protein
MTDVRTDADTDGCGTTIERQGIAATGGRRGGRHRDRYLWPSARPGGAQHTITLFFKDTLSFKAWMSTLALAFALFQVVSATRIYGRFPYPRVMPSWYGDAHRLSGTLAFACTLPVVFHCLWSLGFATNWDNPRTVIHSTAGCFFFGLFTAKVLSVRSHKLPGWMLPVLGSLTFVALAVLWATSSLWFFTNKGFPQG